MKQLIKGEFFKFFKNSGFKVILTLSIVSTIVLCGYFQFSVLDIKSMPGVSIFYMLTSGVAYENILFAIIAAYFVCKDFELQTINSSFTYGYNKFQILFSKFVVYLAINLFSIYLIMILSMIYFSIIYGFGVDISLYFIFLSLKTILVHSLTIVSISGITFLIAILIKNSIWVSLSSIIIIFTYVILSNFDFYIIRNILPFDLLINATINHVSSFDILKICISTLCTLIFSLYFSNLYLNKSEFK